MRPGFSVRRAHRLEDLRDGLLESLERDPSPPLESDTIVVGSPGMARWLSLQLARRQGIAASVEFPFPGEWARSLARRLDLEPDGGDGPDPFGSEVLSLRIHELLPELADAEEAGALAHYLSGDDGRRRQSLAHRLAFHFGESQLFRPDVLRGWQEGSVEEVEGFVHERWQAPLWRELCERAAPALPLNEILLRLVEELARESSGARGLRRVDVFGVSTLPPVLLRVLSRMGEHVPVTLYFPDPTVEYWADLQTDRVRERQRRREGEDSLGLYADEFNPLLANLGEQGRELFRLLLDVDPDGNLLEDLESPSPPLDTVLGRVQTDIVRNRDPRQGGRASLDPQDDSLRLHVCHSPRRELEVLHDSLLQAFVDDPELEPSDVLVLVPDMRRYGPFVQAVFGSRSSGTPRIPFTLADRSWEETDPLVRGLLHLLELAASRRSSLEVLDLLDLEPVARRFGFDPASIEAARAWVREVGIRWGSDPEQRAREWGLPDYRGASWEEGLDQLLLGALVGDVDEAVGGTLPHAGVPAASLELVSRLAYFARTLFEVLDALSGAHELPEWSRRLASAVDRVFDSEDESSLETRGQLRRVFASLEEAATSHDLRASWPRAALLSVLRERLDSPPRPAGFLGGSVTFAALRPLRSVPFDILALLGLDDGVFPRIDRRDSLDLLGVDRRHGDRSPRRDDRYLFLESLMSARRRLHLSCVGRSERDGSERARSVVLSEMLDVLGDTFDAGPSSFVVDHRLQGFHPDYFRASRPHHFSFDAEAAAAARQHRETPVPVAPFAADAEDAPSVAAEEVDLADLLEFWRDPGRWFCRRRLGMHLYDEEDAAEEETFAISGLSGWSLRRALLDADPDREEVRPVNRERVRTAFGLPRSAVSETALEEALSNLRTPRRLQAAAGPSEPVPVEVAGDGWILRGMVEGVTDDGLLCLEPGRFHLRHGLSVLLRVAVLAGARCLPSRAVLATSDHTISYTTMDCEDEFRRLLTSAVDAWTRAQRRPVFLQDDVADAVLDVLGAQGDPRDGGAIARALDASKVRKVFHDDYGDTGLLKREAWRLLLRGREPRQSFRDDLGRWLATVYAPVRAWPTRSGVGS